MKNLSERALLEHLFELYDNVLDEYYSKGYDPWIDIENGRIPKTRERMVEYGDMFRDLCRCITNNIGIRTTYEGIEEINRDYELGKDSINTGKYTNRNHIITIHYPFNSQSFGDENIVDKRRRNDCICHILEYIGLHKLEDVRGEDEIKERYAISVWESRHNENFKRKINPVYFRGYINALISLWNLEN